MYLNPKERAKLIFVHIENELPFNLTNKLSITLRLAEKQVQNIYDALQETGQPIRTMVYWETVNICLKDIYNSKIWINNTKSNNNG
jgi:hypothetical protein